MYVRQSDASEDVETNLRAHSLGNWPLVRPGRGCGPTEPLAVLARRLRPPHCRRSMTKSTLSYFHTCPDRFGHLSTRWDTVSLQRCSAQPRRPRRGTPDNRSTPPTQWQPRVFTPRLCGQSHASSPLRCDDISGGGRGGVGTGTC